MSTNNAKPLPKTPAMTLHEQWIRCGKPTCHCAAGQLHGPYTYLFWRADGRQYKRYIRQAEVATMRAVVHDQQQRQHRDRAMHNASRALWRDLRDQLREVEACQTR